MNILYLQDKPCQRALRFARVARDSGVNVYLAYTGRGIEKYLGYGSSVFNDVIELKGLGDIRSSKPVNVDEIQNEFNPQFEDVCSRYGIDAFHSHNWPDVLTVLCINSGLGVPGIHDTHDMGTLNSRRCTTQNIIFEKLANEESDVRVYATSGVKECIEENYNVDPETGIVIMNFPLKEQIPEKLNHNNKDGKIRVVYQGEVSTIPGYHYNMLDIFRNMLDKNPDVEIHVYSFDSPESRKFEQKAASVDGLFYHGFVSTNMLYETLSQYDFGIAAFNESINKKHMDTVVATKIFDYVASGLPVISLPHKSQKLFVRENNIGIVVSDFEGLNDKLRSRKVSEIRERLESFDERMEFSIDRRAEPLIGLYSDLCSTPVTKRTTDKVLKTETAA